MYNPSEIEHAFRAAMADDGFATNAPIFADSAPESLTDFNDLACWLAHENDVGQYAYTEDQV